MVVSACGAAREHCVPPRGWAGQSIGAGWALPSSEPVLWTDVTERSKWHTKQLEQCEETKVWVELTFHILKYRGKLCTQVIAWPA